MKLKKYIGSLLFLLTTTFITRGQASTFMIGIEEMPDSMKKFR